MLTIDDLLTLIDRFRALNPGLTETTLSYRMFGDTKKIRFLRGGRDLTVARFRGALGYLSENWPDDHEVPEILRAALAPPSRENAA